MLKYEILKNEIIANGGLTLFNNDLMTKKSGFIVSQYGYEFTTKDIDEAIKKLVKYGNEFECCGVWYNDGLYYVDANKYFIKSEYNKAINEGIKNKQKAIWSIHQQKEIYLQQNYYTIYKMTKNDFVYVNEFTDLKDVCKLLSVNIKTLYNTITTSLDNIKKTIYCNNNNYIIIKELDDIEVY